MASLVSEHVLDSVLENTWHKEAPRSELNRSNQSFLSKVEAYASFAFQPIVDGVTGRLHAVEALFRGYAEIGFGSVHEVFDYAADNDLLHQLDQFVCDRVMRQFASDIDLVGVRLFINRDSRYLSSADYRPGDTLKLVKKYCLTPETVTMELSERHDLSRGELVFQAGNHFRGQSFKVAIDDFGTGFSGLKAFYQHKPDYIKVDRFFITGITADREKKLFLSHIVSLCQSLGILVIAEGVETIAEMKTCQEIGCNLFQGYLICRPEQRLDLIPAGYEIILEERDARRSTGEKKFVLDEIGQLPTLAIHTPMAEVFDWFRMNKNCTFAPVVNAGNEPIGLLREEDIKEFIYSPFGKDLIANTSFNFTIGDFVSPCPRADINEPPERILEIYTLAENPEGIIVVENMRYVGFLSASSLLRMINETNLARARDDNPLSKLPGNVRVTEYLADCLNDQANTYTLAYYDFDNFKPFNDTYGFRQGDRAIILFADILKKMLSIPNAFIGHIGGDDFLVGLRDLSNDDVALIRDIRTRFSAEAAMFYTPTDRISGGITAKDREGRRKKYKMLTVSAAIARLPAGRPIHTLEDFSTRIANLKKRAKDSSSGVSIDDFT